MTENKSSFEAFKKIGLAVLIGGSVFLAGYQINELDVSRKVEQAEVLVVKNASSVSSYLEQLQQKNVELYKKNENILKSLTGDEAFLKAMAINIDVNGLKKENEQKFNKANQKVQEDIESTNKLMRFSHEPMSDKEKRNLYYDSKDFNNFKDAQSNNAINSQELANINATVQKHSVFLKEIKTELVKAIKEKIENKDFNIAQKRKEFQNKLRDEVYEEKKFIAEIKSEVESDQEMKESVNVDELTKADAAVDQIESLATEQILKDEKLVLEMIEDLSKKEIKVNELAQSGTSQTVSHGGGFNFFQYYLLHSWLSSGTTSPGVSSGVSSVAPSYNGGMRNAMASSNLYSFKEPGSHLNQTMATNGVKIGSGLPYSQVHENIIKTKTNVHTFKSTRVASRASVSIKGSSGG